MDWRARHSRPIGLLLVFGALAGCHTMRDVAPSQLVESSVDHVWVTMADQSTVIVSAPRVMGDTLSGFVEGQYRELHLSDTRAIQQRVLAAGRTTALGVAIGAVTMTTFVYMANRAYVGNGQTCSMGVDAVVVPCCAGKSTLSC